MKIWSLLVDRAIDYNWSTWVGGTANEYSITLHTVTETGKKSISIKLVGDNNAYMATLQDAYNPNHLRASDFDLFLGILLMHVTSLCGDK